MTEWVSAGKLPKEMIDEIKEFLANDDSAKLSFTSQQQILTSAVREFLMKYKYVITRSTPILDPSIELVKVVDKQIILKDSDDGVIVIDIDDDNKLMCYHCSKDPHDNKYIDFVSECEELWPFLKKHNVKYVKPRNKNNKEKINELT